MGGRVPKRLLEIIIDHKLSKAHLSAKAAEKISYTRRSSGVETYWALYLTELALGG
jgi:hypothetical protein